MPRELKPSNAKTRLRRRLDPAKIERDINHIKPIEDWDWEELQKGYPKGPKGKFGPRPRWADVYRVDTEVKRRLRDVSAAELRSFIGPAIRTIVALMEEDGVDLDGKPIVPSSVRLKAAEMVLEHTIGKPVAHLELGTTDTFKDLLASCMVNDDGEDAHPMIVPGVVEEEDDEDWEDL